MSVGFVSSALGQFLVLHQSNESGTYKIGEQLEVRVSLQDMETESLAVRVRKNCSEDVQQKIAYKGQEALLFSDTFAIYLKETLHVWLTDCKGQ